MPLFAQGGLRSHHLYWTFTSYFYSLKRLHYSHENMLSINGLVAQAMRDFSALLRPIQNMSPVSSRSTFRSTVHGLLTAFRMRVVTVRFRTFAYVGHISWTRPAQELWLTLLCLYLPQFHKCL